MHDGGSQDLHNPVYPWYTPQDSDYASILLGKQPPDIGVDGRNGLGGKPQIRQITPPEKNQRHMLIVKTLAKYCYWLPVR